MFEILINLRDILSFIIVLFQAIGFLGLILGGSSRFRQESRINKSVILIIVGAVEIIYLASNEHIFNLIRVLQGYYYTPQLLAIQDTLDNMVPNIISIITFGVLFLYLGISNKQNYGKLLMLSAIFRIICGVILIVPYSITFLANISLTITLQDIQLALIIIPIASIFMITSSVFFMIYSFKIDKKVLFFSSIFLLIASSLFFVNSLVQHMIQNMSI